MLGSAMMLAPKKGSSGGGGGGDDKPLVSLSSYAENNIQDYSTVTEIPQANMDYLNSVSAFDMRRAFYGCSELTSIDLSGLDTSQCYRFTSCFQGCSALSPINMGYLDTSSAEEISYMFRSCSNTVQINLPNWNLLKCNTLDAMFRDCSSVRYLNLFGWQIDTTISSFSASYMFRGCKNLQILTLPSGFETLSPSDLGIQTGTNYTPALYAIRVPSDSVDAYKSAWSAWSSKIVGY